jgi:hypothetical protein
MLSLSQFLFWVYFLLFFVAIFFAWYIPGSLFTRKLHLSLFPQTIISIGLGVVLWGWQGILFGYLGLRSLSYVYLLITLGIWIWQFWKEKPQLKKITLTKIDWILKAIVILGVIVQLTSVWFTGVPTAKGLYFCCGNTSDSLFHASLTQQIIETFPPFQPGMYGTIVHNYHYWSNLVIAELIRVFKLPILATQYQYSTFFLSIFLGLSVIAFCQIIKAKKTYTAWLLFFLYFGGDLAFLISFVFGHGLNFNMTSMEDGTKFLVNPPRAFSINLFFVGLSLLFLWLKKKNYSTGFLTALVFGSIIGFKVYTGLFVIAGLSALATFFLLRANFRMLPPIVSSILLSLLIYLPVNSNSGGIYFTGLWVFENFIVNKDLGLNNWELARVVYQQHGNWLRVTQYELIFTILFFIATFGTKLLGLIQTRKSLSLFPVQLHIFLLTGLAVSLFTGLFFQQSSGGANTFNFLVSLFIIGSLYTALAAMWLVEKFPKKITIIIICTILSLTLPRVTREWVENLKQLAIQNGKIINNEELTAYQFIKEHTPVDTLLLVDTQKFSLSQDSPYVSLLTQRKVFLSGTGILRSHNIDFRERSKTQEDILQINNAKIVQPLLKNNKITYIITSAETKLPTEKKSKIFLIVFKNREIKILKVL